MDGLLIDSEKIYLFSALKCAEEYGYDYDEAFIRSTMGNNEIETKRKFLEKMGPDFSFETFLHQEWVIHQDYLSKYPMEKKKGVDELLDYLEKKGIRKVIATSTARLYAQDFLKSVQLLHRFDHIVYGDDLKQSKPEPEIYLKAIAAFPYDKEEILAFEDSGNGILSAYRAGLKVVHVPDLAYVDENIRNLSFAIFSDLSQAIDLIEKINGG